MTLRTHPRCRVVIPFVTIVAQLAERRLDVIPASLVIEAPPNQFGDERAPPARTHPPIQLRYQLIVQSYVHTHVLILPHNPIR